MRGKKILGLMALLAIPLSAGMARADSYDLNVSGFNVDNQADFTESSGEFAVSGLSGVNFNQDIVPDPGATHSVLLDDNGSFSLDVKFSGGTVNYINLIASYDSKSINYTYPITSPPIAITGTPGDEVAFQLPGLPMVGGKPVTSAELVIGDLEIGSVTGMQFPQVDLDFNTAAPLPSSAAGAGVLVCLLATARLVRRKNSGPTHSPAL